MAPPRNRSKKKSKPPAGRNNSVPVEVRKSRIHGRGVFATRPIRKGACIIEYSGKVRPWPEATADEPHDSKNPNHTFLFGLDNGVDVIDANFKGNAARWINHSCDPNCEARERKGHVYIHALRALRPGEELFYDYALVLDEPRTKKLERDFACHCGNPDCRGTMLEAKEN